MTLSDLQETPVADELGLLIDRYATARLTPAPDQLGHGRAEMLAAFAMVAHMPAPRRRSVLRGWSLAAAFGVLLITGGGLVAAESGPGQPFYGLRLALGSVTLPGEEPAHDRGLADQLDDRLTEVRAAARNGDGRGAQAAISEYLHTLSQLTTDGITDPAILALLQHHQDTLHELLSVAPAQAADGVQDAIDAATNAGVTAPHPTPPQGAAESPPATRRP
jgi:hypothetical protein